MILTQNDAPPTRPESACTPHQKVNVPHEKSEKKGIKHYQNLRHILRGGGSTVSHDKIFENALQNTLFRNASHGLGKDPYRRVWIVRHGCASVVNHIPEILTMYGYLCIRQ